jgi:ABC-type nitrate/sulfonate/bicarbonate transport system permease component
VGFFLAFVIGLVIAVLMGYRRLESLEVAETRHSMKLLARMPPANFASGWKVPSK